jgi:hypothetical protein
MSLLLLDNNFTVNTVPHSGGNYAANTRTCSPGPGHIGFAQGIGASAFPAYSLSGQAMVVTSSGNTVQGLALTLPYTPDSLPTLAAGLGYRISFAVNPSAPPIVFTLGGVQVAEFVNYFNQGPAVTNGVSTVNLFTTYNGPGATGGNSSVQPLTVTILIRSQVGSDWNVETWVEGGGVSLLPVCVGNQVVSLSNGQLVIKTTDTYQADNVGQNSTWTSDFVVFYSFEVANGYELDLAATGTNYIEAIAGTNWTGTTGVTGAADGVITIGYVSYEGNDYALVCDAVSDGNGLSHVRFFTSTDSGLIWNETLFTGNDQFGNASTTLALFDISLNANAPALPYGNIIPAFTLERSPATTSATFSISTSTAGTILIATDSAGQTFTSSAGDTIAQLITAINNASGFGHLNGGNWTATALTSNYSSTPGLSESAYMHVTAAPVNCNGVNGTVSICMTPDNVSMGLDPATGNILAVASRVMDGNSNTAWLVGRFCISGTWGAEFIIAGGPLNSNTANTGGDQLFFSDVRSVIKLQDGRWLIAADYWDYVDFESGDEECVAIVSFAGQTDTQISQGGSIQGYSSYSGSWSATPSWSYNGISVANGGTARSGNANYIGSSIGNASLGNEPCVIQLASGNLLAVGRTSTYAFMSFGSINSSTGVITWVDPTDSLNTNNICLCDGGANSESGDYRRPLIWSGNAPLSLVSDPQGVYVYIISVVQPFNITRGWVTVQQVTQADLTLSAIAANGGLFIEPNPYGTIITQLSNEGYPAFGVNGTTLCGVIGTGTGAVYFRGQPINNSPLPPSYDVYAGVNRGDGVLGTLRATTIATAAGFGVNLSSSILVAGSIVDNVVGTATGQLQVRGTAGRKIQKRYLVG